jgi:hypothetical protein
VVELSNGDVTCGLQRPLSAEFDERPLLTSQKMYKTCERCTVLKTCNERQQEAVVEKATGDVTSDL